MNSPRTIRSHFGKSWAKLADIPDSFKLNPTVLSRLASVILILADSYFCFLGAGVGVLVQENCNFEAF